MNELVNQLMEIYFTKFEASIYLVLLEEPGLSVYQIAKKLNVSRSSIYPVVDNMYKHGMILLMNGESQIYYPENPNTLLTKLKNNYDNNSKKIMDELSKITPINNTERFINVRGYQSIIAKAKELLLKAKKEVYINTDIELKVFEKELQQLHQKNIRVIVFSFVDIDYPNSKVEMYSKGYKRVNDPTRIMLVCDYDEVLVADLNKHTKQWNGTITNNDLMVTIVTEHIHHDIYINKIIETTKKDLFDNPNMRLNTISERGGLHE